MISLKDITGGKTVAVFGLARSGLSTVRVLTQAGIKTIAWDDSEDARHAAAKLGAEIKTLDDNALKECAFLVLAPGVPLHFPSPHPVVLAARAAGTEIICDIELFHRTAHGLKTIGITGTNGKSTTTALIGHVLQSSGVDCAVGGNIGLPVFDMARPGPGGYIVLELSSYQLDLCPSFTPDIAVLLNITPDHLDRHGTMENYAAAKERIFEGTGTAIIGMDDPYSKSVHDRVVKSGRRTVQTLSTADKIIDPIKDSAILKGAHNHQNMMAAYYVCRAAGVGDDQIFAALANFSGLDHRQKHIRRIGAIDFINDSKATNAESTAKALGSYDDIFWIVGGRAKDGGLVGLEPFAPRIRNAFLIGEAQDDFALWMNDNAVPYEKCGTIDNAVRSAARAAHAFGKGVVLLSPACASWDQFSSFEHRGKVFTDLVESLPQTDPA